jgi:hypothetical protein
VRDPGNAQRDLARSWNWQAPAVEALVGAPELAALRRRTQTR